MANIYDMVDTWNDSATLFTAIKMNVADSASDPNSNLLDLQVDGLSKFTVDKNNNLFLGQQGDDPQIAAYPSSGSPSINFLGRDNGLRVQIHNIAIGKLFGPITKATNDFSGYHLAKNDFSDAPYNVNYLCSLVYDADYTWGVRVGTNPQAFNIYNTYTDASNYERGVFRWDTNELIIGSEYAGTGTRKPVKIVSSDKIIFDASYQTPSGTQRINFNISGDTVFQIVDTNRIDSKIFHLFNDDVQMNNNVRMISLPTTDPAVAGRLWNDNGTVKISAG